MPKLLVLSQSHDPALVRLADAAAEGARGVRFAEVDLRGLASSDDAPGLAIDAGGRAYRPLEHVDDIGAYDGLILAVAREADAEDALERTLGAFGGSLANKVGAALTSATGTDRSTVLWSILSSMADREMILVPAPFGGEGASDEESTRRLGKRVAEVIGWVTHARSHHQHGHHHEGHQSHHHHS